MTSSESKGDLGRAAVGRSSPKMFFHLQDQPRVQQKFKDIKGWTFPGGYSSSLHTGRFPEQEVHFLISGRPLHASHRLQHTYAALQSIRSKSGSDTVYLYINKSLILATSAACGQYMHRKCKDSADHNYWTPQRLPQARVGNKLFKPRVK